MTGKTHAAVGSSLMIPLVIFFLFPLGEVPFLLGYMSHLVVDSFTVSGIPLLYPKKKRYGLRKFKTGQSQDYIIRYTCLGVIVIFVVRYLKILFR